MAKIFFLQSECYEGYMGLECELANPKQNLQSSSVPVSLIAGLVVAGVVLIALLVIFYIFYVKKLKKVGAKPKAVQPKYSKIIYRNYLEKQLFTYSGNPPNFDNFEKVNFFCQFSLSLISLSKVFIE